MKFGSKEFVPVILGTGLSAYGIARSRIGTVFRR